MIATHHLCNWTTLFVNQETEVKEVRTPKAQLAEAVIERFQEGDQTAFREVYDVTGPFIFKVIRKMGINETEAEDLAHDIFIRVYEQRAKFDFRVAFTTWVYRVAFNHTLNVLKRKKMIWSKLQSVFFHTDEVSTGEPEYEDDTMQQLLKKLKPEFRMCLVLKELEGYSYEEIATMMDISLGTVKSRLNRAKKELLALYNREVKTDG